MIKYHRRRGISGLGVSRPALTFQHSGSQPNPYLTLKSRSKPPALPPRPQIPGPNHTFYWCRVHIHVHTSRHMSPAYRLQAPGSRPQQMSFSTCSQQVLAWSPARNRIPLSNLCPRLDTLLATTSSCSSQTVERTGPRVRQTRFESWLYDQEPPFTQVYNGNWRGIRCFLWALLADI